MVSLNRLLLAPEGTHLDSSFNFYCTHTPSRIARTLAGVDRRKAGVETIKERRGSQAGGLRPPCRSSRKAAAHEVAATQIRVAARSPCGAMGCSLGGLPMNSPPKRADEHSL